MAFHQNGGFMTSPSHTPLFVRPPSDVFQGISERGYLGYATYSQYNYLRPGLMSRIKAARFEKALRIARDSGDMDTSSGAIDVGCADGILLPSLSKHFQHVLALDTSAEYIGHARVLVEALGLSNIDLLCTTNLTFESIANQIAADGGGKRYGVAFVLETVEHVGDKSRLYESKVDFIREVGRLLEPGGAIIISVPRMVGPLFLAKYLTQSALRMHHERLSPGQLFRSSFLARTDDLEPLWTGGHVGFNHVKLERALRQAFPSVQRWGSLTSVFYRIQMPR
jgi:2-polyprenyl-3-methyl-5-hydroxy-6-metoxy-1,4-benzoquinol methylase